MCASSSLQQHYTNGKNNTISMLNKYKYRNNNLLNVVVSEIHFLPSSLITDLNSYKIITLILKNKDTVYVLPIQIECQIDTISSALMLRILQFQQIVFVEHLLIVFHTQRLQTTNKRPKTCVLGLSTETRHPVSQQ